MKITSTSLYLNRYRDMDLFKDKVDKASHILKTIIKRAFYTQLQYDGISISLDNVNRLLNDVHLYPTDNDRSTTAYQNTTLWSNDAVASVFSNEQIVISAIRLLRLRQSPTKYRL